MEQTEPDAVTRRTHETDGPFPRLAGASTRAQRSLPPATDAVPDNVTPFPGATAPVDDVITFAPIPLASGQAVVDDSGVPHRAASVEVVVTAVDGTQKRIPLEYRHGGWWAPAAY